jgi:two-component system, OmpR family, response regulator MprA
MRVFLRLLGMVNATVAITPMSSRILLVDDDAAVLSGLRRVLALDGYDVLVEQDGESALATAESSTPDLIVLDVMLPGIDGFTVCEHLRRMTRTPILMLTAKDTVPDRVEGLDRGADDYLVKPFASDELAGRVRALLRRSQPEGEGTLTYADLSLDLTAREAYRGGQHLRLTPREYELLVLFMHHPRQALSREQICQQVWGYAFEGESNFVDVAIKELRKKLEAEGAERLIQTVRGFGYALKEE